jgi:PKD repeat protein
VEGRLVYRSSYRLPAALLLAFAALPVSVRLAGQDLTSTAQSPTVTFTTPGDKQVTLEVCNLYGCSSVTKTVTVLDPSPVIDGMSVGPVSVEAGKLVRLAGAGHGKPPLTFDWNVVAGAVFLGGAVVAQPAGATAWWDTAGKAPGTYLIDLDLRNAVGTKVSSELVTVTVVPETGTSFYTVEPCRLLDTRSAGGGALVAGTVRSIDVVAAGCGIPVGAEAISANVTVVSPTGPGFVSIYPGNYPTPVTSTLNFKVNQVRANNAILALASDGTGTLAATAVLGGGGTVQLLIDVNGYFL